jgi:Rod binding domain-containing protein
MSNPIAALPPFPGKVQPVAYDPRAAKLRHAATEFESLLVKQLLKAAKIGGAGGGAGGQSGYADMAVDALATSIERGGGLGLARRIEEAIRPAIAPRAEPSARPLRTSPSAGGKGG